MRLLVLLANGFEDVEALGTIDVLLRGGDEVIVASMNQDNVVDSKCGIKMEVKDNFSQLDLSSFDGLIIPGGPASFRVLNVDQRVDEAIDYFAKQDKLVAAICAAPFLVGRRGYFQKRNFTIHPGFENQVIGGNYLRNHGVVVDGNFITAKSMFYSLEFGLAIHSYFHGNASKEKLMLACQGEK